MIQLKQALVVDDNVLNIQLVGMMLRRLGWSVQSVNNGAAALDLLASRYFDLVLLDLRMPAMSGEAVCGRIRDDLALTNLPVVAFTAHSTPEEKQRILDSGFDGLLVKPISYRDVKDLCDAL